MCYVEGRQEQETRRGEKRGTRTSIIPPQVFTEDKSTLAIRLVEGGQILKFMSGEAEAIMKAANSVISKWQNQQPVS